jgi:hypothetical protein
MGLPEFAVPKHQELSAEDQRLSNKLAAAGVDWEQPLSAVGYADWR